MIEHFLTWPASAESIQASAESVTKQIDSQMTAAIERLDNLAGDAGYARGALSLVAENLLGLRGELDALLNQGQVLTVSPYQFQVGSTYDSGQYLNPQTAINALASKLRDQVDKNRPTGALSCIVVVVSESQLTTFASTLTSLTTVLPLPDWCQVKRQVMALQTNAEDKLYQPGAITLPRFKPQANLNADPLRTVLTQQGAQIASLESLANDSVNVMSKLQALALKRVAKLDDISDEINALKTLSGSVWSAELNGTPESIASQLVQLTLPNTHQYTMASVLLSSAPHTFFKALLC